MATRLRIDLLNSLIDHELGITEFHGDAKAAAAALKESFLIHEVSLKELQEISLGNQALSSKRAKNFQLIDLLEVFSTYQNRSWECGET